MVVWGFEASDLVEAWPESQHHSGGLIGSHQSKTEGG